ncbi:MAG: hypothetical protein PHW18_12630 [Sulfuricurvum sp.]|uniref:hypothetical protein n=1 Tax=Sulfuricurvum sp. TaxID=2025608 RepID=UPI002637C0AA|nr:hypothetical protein [Sulfuricurvum sp.]MDD2830412.1 hypothetical protein [Sulfuricurvum sp.]
MILTSVAQAAPKWITVSKADCIDNGGEMKNGVCSANWQDAGGICSAIGASLPTIGQLKGVIKNCGGVVGDDNNANKQTYQSCYKKRGFLPSNNRYWSSYADVAGDAWYVDFYDGVDLANAKNYSYYVRCVRGGQ